MRRPRIAYSVTLAGLAVTVAVLGAAANLTLLAPHGTSDRVLSLDRPPGSSTTVDPGTSPPPTSDTSTTETPTSGPPDGGTTSPPPTSPPTTQAATTRSYAVGTAGSVELSVRDGVLVVDAVRPASGWTYVIEKQSSDEVEIHFQTSGQKAELHARLDDGALRVEIDGDEGPDD